MYKRFCSPPSLFKQNMRSRERESDMVNTEAAHVAFFFSLFVGFGVTKIIILKK